MSMSCPCCGSAARHVRALPRAALVTALNALMPQGGVEACTFGDYTLWCCTSCTLEFAEPMTKPGRDLYAWMTRADYCYPPDRWEWSAFISKIAPRAENPATPFLVLDVGCGMGRFLKRLAALPGCRAVGLDVNLQSVETCRAAGLEVLHGDLEDCLDRLGSRVDAVTLWHVVEHLADPIGLVERTKTLLAPGGVIALSVPLSPMSHEATFPDPLNLPPHHLTRWTLPALRAFAARVGMDVELVVPLPDPLLARVVRPVIWRAISPFEGVRGARRWLRLAHWLVLHPWALAASLRDQLARPRVDGRVQPDVVLAILSPRR